MILFKLLLFCGGLALGSGAHGEGNLEAGMIIRLNNLGLDKHYELAINAWRDTLLNNELLSFEKDNYLVRFNITSVDFGTNSFDTSPPNSFTHRTKDANLQIAASWVFFSDGQEHSGTTIVDATGITVGKQVLLDVGDDNLSEFHPGKCNAEVKDINFEIFPQNSAVDLLLEILSNKLKIEFEEKVCDAITEELVFFFQKIMGWSEPSFPIGIYFPEFDGYNFKTILTRAPLFNDDGITFFVDGVVYNIEKNPSQTVPFEPSAPPTLSSSRQMVQLLFTEYFFNTLDYARWQDGQFDGNFPISVVNELFNQDYSASAQAEKYPIFEPYVNRSIEYNVTTVQAPHSTINESGIFTTEIRHALVNAILENNTRETFYEYDYVMETLSQLYVLNNAIHRRVLQMRFITEESSPDNMFDIGIPSFLLHLNDQYARSPYITLTFEQFEMESSTVKMLEGGVDFAGEVGFLPK